MLEAYLRPRRNPRVRRVRTAVTRPPRKMSRECGACESASHADRECRHSEKLPFHQEGAWRVVAQPGGHRASMPVDQLLRLVAVEHRRFCFLNDMLAAAHGGGGIGAVQNLADDQPVERHADAARVVTVIS